MFDILKIQKKKIVSNAVNLMPRYRSYISYNWTTTFDGSGNRQLINAGESNPIYKATMRSGRGVKFNGTDQTIHIDVTQGQTLYKFDATNNSLVTENITFTGVYELGKVGGAGAYESIIYSNVIVSNTAFTDSELDYLHSHPEKFLYPEKQADGTFVAKSEILTQEKIDSVVAHFPMCEIDGFVRNMIGYSEGDAFDTIFDGNYKIDQSGDTYTATDVVGNTKLGQNETYEVGDVVKVNINISNINTDEWRLININISTPVGNSYFTDNRTLEYIGIVTDTSARVEIRPDTKNGTGSVDITDISIRKITSTYPIENFTNVARDDANNLTTGLQACLLETDGLGVMVGSSFNELTCNFDNAPIRLTMTDTELSTIGGGSWQFETILRIDNSTQRTYLFNTYYGSKGLALYTNIVTNLVYLYIYDGNSGVTNVHWEVTDTSLPNHFIFEYDGTTLYLFINGNLVSKATGGFVPSGLVLANIQNVGMKGDIRLFNIHTTTQDPAKLYADAVKKGLVPEQTQST